MKRLSTLVLIIAVTLFASFSEECFAENDGATPKPVTLKKTKKERAPDKDPQGVRVPPRDIIAIITVDEFQSAIDPDDIISYEVWDETEAVCIASFSEDSPFCQFLFNTSGNYLIKILTEHYIYIGFISTI